MHESSGMTTPSEINQALCQRNTRYVHSCRFAWLNPVKQNKNTALAGNPLPRLTRTGQPVDGAMLRVAERRNRAAYPELAAGGPHTLVVLGSEIGGAGMRKPFASSRTSFASVLPRRAGAARTAWTRRRWCQLSFSRDPASGGQHRFRVSSSPQTWTASLTSRSRRGIVASDSLTAVAAPRLAFKVE